MMYINGQAVAPTNLVKEGHNYSTNEQVVGTWIDGKPLYEKTIHTNALTSDTWNATEIGNNLSLKMIDGFLSGLHNAGGPILDTVVPFISYEDSLTFYVQGYHKDNKAYVSIWRSGSFFTASPTAYITVRYTKTTD